MIEYRIADEIDLPALAELRYSYWQEEGQDSPESSKEAFFKTFSTSVRKAMLSNQLYCWLAIENQKIVATLYVQVVRKLPKPSKVIDQFGYATNFYTVPSHRGRGIGRTLLKTAKEWAKTKDLEFLVTWPSAASTELWKSEGFQEDDSLTCSIRSYVN